MNKTTELLLAQIDEATESIRMTPAEAHAFLEELLYEIERRMDRFAESIPDD